MSDFSLAVSFGVSASIVLAILAQNAVLAIDLDRLSRIGKICRATTSQPRTPVKKSSMGVLSPDFFQKEALQQERRRGFFFLRRSALGITSSLRSKSSSNTFRSPQCRPPRITATSCQGWS
jgi:hypothetical protein